MKLMRGVKLDPRAPGDSKTMKLKVPLNYGDIINDALRLSGADTQQQAQAYQKMEDAIILIEYGAGATVLDSQKVKS
jgi:hypothetical protein